MVCRPSLCPITEHSGSDSGSLVLARPFILLLTGLQRARPVRALKNCAVCTRSIRRTDRLFVRLGIGCEARLFLSSSRLAERSVRDLAYSVAALPRSARPGAHSTRGLVVSWVPFRGASLEEVCAAVGFVGFFPQIRV